ncbi:flagellar basal body P-ring biosynthesis protein FlgA [Gimesia alba]|uniref:Flagellar basal body P-ring biosynthesis protein FlgA n=1 Tax=Gimesia alba TaxID=2527973 RepID=A0A517RAH1_9PLAN|nr:flagellar basal body P-ring biosynthesis protein FlgA [Gimesia alba]
MFRLGINSCLSCLLVICCLSRGGELNAEILRLKAAAVVDSPIVRLGDVADVLNADPEQAARMEQMTLLPAPSKGRTRVITVSEIRGRLQALGVDLSRLELTGKSQVRVTLKEATPTVSQNPVATQQTIQKAEAKVQQALSEWIKVYYPDASAFTVTVRVQPADASLILANRADSFRFPGLNRFADTEQIVGMNLIDAQGTARLVRLFCRIQNVPEILAAKYSLNKGTVIRADDLMWVRPEKNQTGITDPRLVIGRELTRTVHQSNVMRSQDLMEVPLIRDGAIVTVYARRGGISVKREMRARGTGGMGDSITLIALEGRDRLTATVTGYNQAEVNYRPASEVQRSAGIQFISGTAEPTGSIQRTGGVRNARGPAIRRGGIRR